MAGLFCYPLCRMPNHRGIHWGFVSAEGAGKVKWNVAPRPPSQFTQIRPPCDSTIDLLIAKLAVVGSPEYFKGRKNRRTPRDLKDHA